MTSAIWLDLPRHDPRPPQNLLSDRHLHPNKHNLHILCGDDDELSPGSRNYAHLIWTKVVRVRLFNACKGVKRLDWAGSWVQCSEASILWHQKAVIDFDNLLLAFLGLDLMVSKVASQLLVHNWVLLGCPHNNLFLSLEKN